MKRWCAILIVLVAVFAFVPSNASAQISQGWHTVTIDRAGPLFGAVIIRVDESSGAFTDAWLELNPANSNALLATALTVQSTGEQARIWVMNDPHDIAGITVQTCYSVLFFPQ